MIGVYGNVWLHKKYGDVKDYEVEFDDDGVILIRIKGTHSWTHLNIYTDSSVGLIEFKNKVLWAYEQMLRRRKRNDSKET